MRTRAADMTQGTAQLEKLIARTNDEGAPVPLPLTKAAPGLISAGVSVVVPTPEGAVRIGSAPINAECVADLDKADVAIINRAMTTKIRASFEDMAENEEAPFDGVSAGSVALLVPSVRNQLDEAHRRAMSRRIEPPDKAVGARIRPIASEEAITAVMRTTPRLVIATGSKGPTILKLTLMLGEPALVFDKLQPTGAHKSTWGRAVVLARYAIGGTAVLSPSLSEKQRLAAMSFDRAELRHSNFIARGFSLHNYGTPLQPSASGEVLWALRAYERLSEETRLKALLYRTVRELADKHSEAVARRYLFCHWLVRVVSTLGRLHDWKPTFLCSTESPLVKICLDSGTYSLALVLDRALKGKSPGTKE